MTNLLVAALSLAISQVILSGALLLRELPRWQIPQHILFWFLVAIMAYLLHPVFAHHWFSDWLIPMQTAIPGLFWLLCSSLFDDRFTLKWWHLSLLAATVVLPLVGLLFNHQSALYLNLIFDTLPQALEFVLLAWALYWVVRFWRDDLIQARRDLRLIFSTIAGLYIFTLVILRELVITDQLWMAQWQYLPVSLVCLILNLLFLQYKPLVFDNAINVTVINHVSSKAESKVVEIPPEIFIQLEQLMLQERVYREMGLTIGQLATRLDLPEYRLRKIINAGLGYRNFNDYLNGFRIKEAGDRLADPDALDHAVLNIALDVGFRSLGSFNKAFREIYGVTPTAFRQQYAQ